MPGIEFGVRNSEFGMLSNHPGRISDFGFRISDFPPTHPSNSRGERFEFGIRNSEFGIIAHPPRGNFGFRISNFGFFHPPTRGSFEFLVLSFELLPTLPVPLPHSCHFERGRRPRSIDPSTRSLPASPLRLAAPPTATPAQVAVTRRSLGRDDKKKRSTPPSVGMTWRKQGGPERTENRPRRFRGGWKFIIPNSEFRIRASGVP